jgi:hypothetical protein
MAYIAICDDLDTYFDGESIEVCVQKARDWHNIPFEDLVFFNTNQALNVKQGFYIEEKENTK